MSRRRWGAAGVVLAVAGAAGCSLIFDPDRSGSGNGGDAGAMDGALPDVSPACVGRTQVALGAINSAAEEDDPSVSRDGTLLVFNRHQLPDEPDIWFATRATPCDVWNTPAPLPGDVNTIAAESGPLLSPDDTTLTFSRRGADFDVLVAEFDSVNWTVTGTLLSELGVNELDFFLTSGSNGFASRDTEIHPITGGTPFPALDLLPEEETGPWLNATTTEMVFAARDPSGTNQFLIYRTQRPMAAAEFEAPDLVPLPQISVEDPWVTSDRLLYYAAQPEVLTDDRDLFLTEL